MNIDLSNFRDTGCVDSKGKVMCLTCGHRLNTLLIHTEEPIEVDLCYSCPSAFRYKKRSSNED